MKIFILLLYVAYGDGSQLTSVEYSSQEKCEAAGKAARVEMKGIRNVYYVCSEK